MTFRLLLAALALTAASCTDIPADPDGTLERVRREGMFKVGVIAPGETPAAVGHRRLFLHQVAALTGARPDIQTGAMEPLLLKLEEGELDLVVGHMAPKSPWGKRVTLLPPLHEQVSSQTHRHLVAAAKNGENAWIALLHPAASAVRAQP